MAQPLTQVQKPAPTPGDASRDLVQLLLHRSQLQPDPDASLCTAASFPKDKGKILHGRSSNTSHGVCPSPAQRGVREQIHLLMLGVFMFPAASTDSHVK